MLNSTINGYTIKRLLGKGGMAEVWYVENRLGKPAAIKLMLPKFLGEEQVIKRFETEARAMVQLNHPNIRQVFDYGEYEDRPFIIMEYLEGKDLSDYIHEGKKAGEAELKSWWRQCLEALSHTHAQGIIHRDIKPSNIFLCNTGTIKLLDFGISKIKDEISITNTGQGLGTLLYMSPEQILDPKRVTAYTDIYSLAISFVHLIQGRSPFIDTDSAFKLQQQIASGQPDLSSIGAEWLKVLKPCLDINTTRRPQIAQLINNLSGNSETTVIYPIPENQNEPLLSKKVQKASGNYWWVVGSFILTLIIILIIFTERKVYKNEAYDSPMVDSLEAVVVDTFSVAAGDTIIPEVKH